MGFAAGMGSGGLRVFISAWYSLFWLPLSFLLRCLCGQAVHGRQDIVRALAATRGGDAVAFTVAAASQECNGSEAAPEPEPEPEPELKPSADAPSLRIRVVTWNVGECDVATLTSASLSSLLQPAEDRPEGVGLSSNAPELVAVGLQEIEMSAEAFGANVLERVSTQVRELSAEAAAVNKLRKIETATGEAWAQKLASAAGGLGYREVCIQQMVGVFLAVFVRSDRFQYVREVVPATVGCGAGLSSGVDGFANGVEKVMGPGSRLGGLIAGARALGEEMRGLGLPETGNKGACGVRMMMHGTSVVLVAAHLAAGQTAASRRESDWRHIEKSLAFELATGGGARQQSPALAVEEAATRKADIAAFFGDLNYRLDLPPEETARALHDAALQQRQEHEATGDVTGGMEDTIAGLLQHDQLLVARTTGDPACAGWVEEAIRFPPTYKFQPGSTEYDIAPPKARTPSWTDRILFRAKRGQCDVDDGASGVASSSDRRIRGRHYDARMEPSFEVSDHRPVTLLLEAVLPTEAELLARDLRLLGSYLAAAAAADTVDHTSADNLLDTGIVSGTSSDRERERAAVIYYTENVEVSVCCGHCRFVLALCRY